MRRDGVDGCGLKYVLVDLSRHGMFSASVYEQRVKDLTGTCEQMYSTTGIAVAYHVTYEAQLSYAGLD